MTRIMIAALALGFSATAWAECSVSDFSVEGFSVAVDNCRGSRCPKLNLAGKLVNHCAAPAAAQIEIAAKDETGRIIKAVDGWPAMTSNLAPGEAREFDFGPMMGYKPGMVDFSVAITDVKRW